MFYYLLSWCRLLLQGMTDGKGIDWMDATSNCMDGWMDECDRLMCWDCWCFRFWRNRDMMRRVMSGV